jgi:phosphatidylglycerol:prolipoprotein diacylglycerol transferase
VRPTLFTLPFGAHGLGVHSYGLAIALGFGAGVVLAAREARRVGLDPGAMLDLLFWILVSGVLGSRLTFVAVHAGDFVQLCRQGDCAAPLKLWQGGLVFYGGALAATGAVALFTRRQRWSFGQVADILAPALALGHVFGRMGCFFAGCCFGKPCRAVGVSFPPGSVAFDELVRTGVIGPGASGTPPLHPTQLYEAAGELAIFFLLLLTRRRRPFAGATALLYAVAYAVLRFGVELLRGDAGRGSLGPLSTAQVTSLIVGTSAAVLLVVGGRRSRGERLPLPTSPAGGPSGEEPEAPPPGGTL